VGGGASLALLYRLEHTSNLALKSDNRVVKFGTNVVNF
jgi:hypothetical protein